MVKMGVLAHNAGCTHVAAATLTQARMMMRGWQQALRSSLIMGCQLPGPCLCQSPNTHCVHNSVAELHNADCMAT